MKAFVRLLVVMLLAAGFGATPSVQAQCVVPPLSRVGPVDPVHGFPQYYMDSNGLALAPCLNFTCDPALALPDPNAPVVFPTNFPDEFFYFRAIAGVSSGTLKAVLVLAIEGAFINGPPAAGDQVTFARTRVTITGAAPGGVYAITQPYGVATLTADSLGNARFTNDVGGVVPGVFTPALTDGIGPFLRFLAGPVPPAPRNIGTSLAPQTVTGSPCGTNLFRVVGPGLPVGGAQTDQFDTLIGELAVLCGNGFLEPGEQCDDGNTVAGDCCSPTCTFEPAGQACDDGAVCTVNSTCDGAGFCRVVGGFVGPCNDGNACTLNDTCSGITCVPGPRATCPPGGVVEADAYVDANSAGTNFGNRPQVFVDGSPQRQGLYRVRVSGAGLGTITKALLRLTVASVERAGTSGGRIHLANCGWAENTVTWNTRPAFNAFALDTKAAVNQGNTVDFDVSPVVTGDGVYCFTIDSTNANGVQYNSREAGAGRPQLVLTSSCCVPQPPAPPRCGDNIVNQPTEQCDGTDAAVCPGLCLPNCTCCQTVTTCAAQGATCGTIPNGCGGTLTCGVCTAPQTCGGGGVANSCGCTPTTCAAQGKNCGTIPNGCGGTLACGVCTAPQTCGGGGVPNVCGVGCVPTTCAAQGKNCGTIPDGCGGTLTCGVCTAPQTCGGGGVANVCGAPAAATLTLTATGRGGERVTSTPAGLNVATGTTASASFATGTSITLQATNARDVIFSGVCSSNGAKVKTCTFTLNANASETANVQ